jgi:hypothetical protein
MRRAGLHDARDLSRRPRPHDRERASVIAAAPVDLPGRQVTVGVDVAFTDGVTQF